MKQVTFHNETFNVSAVVKYPADTWISWAMPRFFQKKPEATRQEMLTEVYNLCCKEAGIEAVVAEVSEEVTEEATEEVTETESEEKARKPRSRK